MTRKAQARESSNFAIIIGIDAYQNSLWNLGAAVRDALRFADWTLEHGGVAQENLRLLLSPATTRKATHLPYTSPTRGNIVQTIQDFQESDAGRGSRRLYFYFAGHGLSVPGARAAAQVLSEPVIVPSDVTDIKRDAALLIGFSDIFPLLFSAEPREQFFFIDACRDFELEDFRPAIGRAVGPYNPASGGDANAPGSAQYILYATSPGQRAHERKSTGLGVFADALLEGLGGSGSALVWTPSTLRYEVRFNKLAEFVASRVDAAIKDEEPEQWSEYIQIPQPKYPQNAPPDASLISFAPDEVKKVEVKLKVNPPAARSTCKVQALQYVLGGRKRSVIVEKTGPPFCPPCTFKLLPGEYTFRAQASSYGEDRKALSLYEKQSVSLSLKREPAALRQLRARPAQEDARLTVTSPDNKVVIVIRDLEKRPVLTGFGKLETFLPPGMYHVDAILPDEIRTQAIEVLAGDETNIVLDLPGAQIGQRQLSMLQRIGIDTDPSGHVHPSEAIGGVAKAKLASLLGFAAFAANWPEANAFIRLKRFGIKTLKLMPGGSGLMVIVGVGTNRPLDEMSTSEFLRGGRMTVSGFDEKRFVGDKFHILPKFPDAAQQQMRLPPNSYFLELDLPGFTRTRYAISCLPDRITVVVVAIEESGEVAVQQYLLPVLRGHSYTQNERQISAADVRRVELAQRYYANGQQIPQADMENLLYGKWIDPLLGCLAGYSLVRSGNAERYIGKPNPQAGPKAQERSAMRNMLKFFGELPDSHVLAGLCEPDRRDEHYARAASLGVPVFAEGFRVLYDWYRQQGERLPERLMNRAGNLLPASPWTAWLSEEAPRRRARRK